MVYVTFPALLFIIRHCKKRQALFHLLSIEMSSRKKAKGKQRKAKAAAQARQDGWEGLARWGEENTSISCSHGAMIPENGHIVSSFLDSYQQATSKLTRHFAVELVNFLGQTCHETYPEVWRCPEQRKMLIDILLGMGTNALLIHDGGGSEINIKRAKIFCSTILLLEHYGIRGDFGLACGSCLQNEAKDVSVGGFRDTLRFYSKRISCSCLKKMYTQSKVNEKKVGRCDHCRKTFERNSLMLCSKCKTAQYCSADCQRAHWLVEHKYSCHLLASI